MHKAAWRPCLILACWLGWQWQPALATGDPAAPSEQTSRRLVLVGNLSEIDTIVLTTGLAASRRQDVLLFDSPGSSAANQHFLKEYRPQAAIAVGQFPKGLGETARRLRVDIKTSHAHFYDGNLAQDFFPQAKKVVICPPQPRSLLLQAACLAGIIRAPLYVLKKNENQADFQALLASWQTRDILVVGECDDYCRRLGKYHLTSFADAPTVLQECLKRLAARRTIKTLVVANPADTAQDRGSMSLLSPWVAVQKKAPLLLTNKAGTNVAKMVTAACQQPELPGVDSLVLVGNLQALPLERRPNPLAGKDRVIEMEPLTPTGQEPVSFAIGRLFHQDRAVVALMLARSRLLREQKGQVPKALLVSNPGGGLPLLEAMSRNTAQEFRNAGFATTGLFGRAVDADEIRRLLPQQTIFLWEGHQSTLFRSYEAHAWPEPLRPSLIFLQSCLALTEDKAGPFLQRGAIGLVGTSTRTYSASGGAFAMAFCDSLLYEKQTVGGALRQAKNFLLAFARLKEKRLGEVKMNGASHRAAWAFSLWGDPTVRLPMPLRPEGALTAIRHRVRGNKLIISLPDMPHDQVVSAQYQAEIHPNARLAGLLTKQEDTEVHPLVPLIFAEVHLKPLEPDWEPQLCCKLPEQNWVFCWDKRRSCGYLLVRPRPRDRHEIRFTIDWMPATRPSTADSR